MIRSFKVLNAEAKGMNKGMAHPGFFYIDESGMIREAFFEGSDLDRFTPNNVIRKLFPELAEGVSREVEAPRPRLGLAQSDRMAAPGNRLTLAAEVELPRGIQLMRLRSRGTSRSSSR